MHCQQNVKICVKIVPTYRRHLRGSLVSDCEDGYYPTVYSDGSRRNSEMRFAVSFAASVHILFSVGHVSEESDDPGPQI